MHPQKEPLLWIILIGGAAVIGSYLVGFLPHPENLAAFWGGVPENLRSLYTVSMLLAALGYFAYSYYLLFSYNQGATTLGKSLRFGVFHWLYLGILIPSALWLPLTWEMVARPGPAVWLAIRLVLALVGLASLGIMAALLRIKPQKPGWAYWLAMIGSAIFFLHTGILDALVWTAFFLR